MIANKHTTLFDSGVVNQITTPLQVVADDDTPIGVWVGILAAAIIVGGGAAYGVKRKKKK